jgi:formimidoylglutamate deiminase
MNRLFAHHALLPEGWCNNVLLEWSTDGTLHAARADVEAPTGVQRAHYVLPGMINLHSHSFQRALGGMTEQAGDTPDSFWTWRDLMYRFARQITPEQMGAIAAQLFSECLRHGYTSICEFHYVHRQPDGSMYAQPAETAQHIADAARLSGIGLTMLPVLYSYSGFGAAPLKPEQNRFRTDAADILQIVDALSAQRGPQLEVGVAPHSLRAASVAQISEVLAALPAQRPVHIHIAEQRGEVQQSLDFSQRRPVQYLYDQLPVDQRWCLVHATHLVDEEVKQIAAAAQWRACVPPLRPILATACSRWKPSWLKAAASASAATATCRKARSKSCAGLNTASVLLISAAISRFRARSAKWAIFCGRPHCRAARRRQDAPLARWNPANGPTCWCWMSSIRIWTD